jgi:hypothetical protein
MTLSVYDVTVPPLVIRLKALSAILDKATAYAEHKKFDPKALLEARLFPNMFPLLRQIQVACDMAKGGVARLAGVDAPKFEDTESTFEELKARIAKTIDFIESVQPAQLLNAESRTVTMTFPSSSLSFKGVDFLNDFALPNFYFHLSMSYALLRQAGLDVGKRDFLSAQA